MSDEAGCRPLMELAVRLVESQAEAWGCKFVWAPHLTLEDKAAIIGRAHLDGE